MQATKPQLSRDSGRAARWRRPGIAALLAAYLLCLSWDGLRATFAQDEMMAIWTYWHPSPWRLLTSQFLLWRGYFRPLGGLFYLPLFQAFGLNPLPYHIVLLALLTAGAYAMYRLARALGTSEMTSAIVAFIACYHLGLSNLYYDTVFVFDVLCGLFYFTSVAYYAGIRASGRLLSGGQTAAFLGLYLCTLNSKEMAVTMPVILLAYELLYHPPSKDTVSQIRSRIPEGPLPDGRGSDQSRARQQAVPRYVGELPAFWAWLRGPGRVLCWAGLMNIVYIWGKRFGQYGLMKSPGYLPVFSWERVVDFQERYLGDIFLNLPRVGGGTVVSIWLIVTYLAWRRNRPVLRLCWFYILVTPLPIEFLIGRDQACLYVTLAGWAVFAAVIFTDIVRAAPALLADEPIFRRLRPRTISATVLAAGVLLWAEASWRFQAEHTKPFMAELGPRTWQMIQAFRAANPGVEPHSRVVFLDDPFRNFDTAFIAELWFKDRTVTVRLHQATPLSPDEIAHADHVFTFEADKLIQVR